MNAKRLEGVELLEVLLSAADIEAFAQRLSEVMRVGHGAVSVIVKGGKPRFIDASMQRPLPGYLTRDYQDGE